MSEHAFVRGEWQGDQWQPSDDDDADGMPVGPRGVSLSEDDRALLELAARAIGAVRIEEVEGENWVNLHFADGVVVYGWNPLHFSGDAFELAVKLELLNENATFQHHLAAEQSRGGDPLAAAMRATALTAAEIGEAMALGCRAPDWDHVPAVAALASDEKRRP